MPPKVQCNYLNLQLCLTEANKFLRKLFKNRWKQVFHKEWKDTEVDASFFVEHENGKEIMKQLKGRQSQISLETGNSKEWDLNILTTILLSKRFQEIKFKVHIENIKEIRNKLLNLPEMSVSDERFEELFEAFQKSMKSLCFEESKLTSLKNEFVNQRSKTSFNEDAEFKSLIDVANKEFSEKKYKDASKTYSNIINSYEHSNEVLGDLYYKRSLANLRIYDDVEDDTKDEKLLYQSLSDAEKAIDYRPYMTTGYIQAAELSLKLNELAKSEKYYEKALAIECDNSEFKNGLAFVRSKIGEQERQEHLDLRYLQLSMEESNELLSLKLKEDQGISIGNEKINKLKKVMEKIHPIKADVYLGHEYRVGSIKIKQNYEMAAKCYRKAAEKKDAEALYNLALLHMKGQGVKLDYKVSLDLLKEAATQPDTIKVQNHKIPNDCVSDAEHALGLLYQQGMYVEENITMAVYWYERAVKHNNDSSANNLGLLYQRGIGVKQNFDKAEELFLLSNRLGNDRVINNLVELYLLKNDADQALIWHTRALENKNNTIAMSKNDEIMKQINSLKEINKILENRDEISEEKSNIVKQLLLQTTLNLEKKLSPCVEYNSVYKYKPDMLSDYAFNRGSVIAERMLRAQLVFFQAMQMLQNGEYKSNVESLIKLMSQAFQLESLVCGVPADSYDKIIEILQNYIKTNKNMELDCHARISLMYLNRNIEFINSSLLKHPKTKIMHELRGCLYCFEQKWAKGLNDFEEALKIDPKCYDNLYYKGSALFQMEKYNKSIETFKKFHSITPKDFRKLPDTYYMMSLSVLTNDKSQSLIYYKEGLKSEKDQLPCFLPFESSIKDQIGFLFEEENLKTDKNNNRLPVSLNSSAKEENIREVIAKDYRRISLILLHREFYKSMVGLDGHAKIFLTKNPIKKQSLESIIGLKPVFLRDIDFSKDHVLKNSILSLKSIEIPLTVVSTSYIAIDEKNFAERVSIYNLKEGEKKEQLSQIGCHFSIINPYVRMAQDGMLIDEMFYIFLFSSCFNQVDR